ncbi:MAG TPA: hypothetical protein DCE18_19740, partial [Syntrophobacteraceae bacterium]|nr:hypothetical protein [Syntrophobacteraceae bacterium]
MPHKIPRQAPASGTDGIIRVVLLYAVFASLWIVLSDKGVEWLFHDSAHIVLVGTLKGGLFVAVTSLLLYGLMRRLLGTMPTASTPSTGSWRWLRVSLALVLLAIVVVTAGSMVGGYRHEKDKEVARLEAISDLKASQIADWIKERDLDGHFVQSSRFFADRYRDWRDTGDSVSGDMLKQRLNEYRNDRLFHGVLLLDEQSEVLWNSEGTGEALSPDLQAAAAEAATAGRARRVGPYLDANGRPRLDIVAPLLLAGDHRRPVVVLRVDPAAYLFPTLRSWPVPS